VRPEATQLPFDVNLKQADSALKFSVRTSPGDTVAVDNTATTALYIKPTISSVFKTDSTIKDSAGNSITDVNSLSTHLVLPNGQPVSATNKLPVDIGTSGSQTTILVDGAPVSSTHALPVSSTNTIASPMYTEEVVAGQVVSGTNRFPVSTGNAIGSPDYVNVVVGGSVISSSNPLPVSSAAPSTETVWRPIYKNSEYGGPTPIFPDFNFRLSDNGGNQTLAAGSLTIWTRDFFDPNVHPFSDIQVDDILWCHLNGSFYCAYQSNWHIRWILYICNAHPSGRAQPWTSVPATEPNGGVPLLKLNPDGFVKCIWEIPCIPEDQQIQSAGTLVFHKFSPVIFRIPQEMVTILNSGVNNYLVSSLAIVAHNNPTILNAECDIRHYRNV